MNFPSERFPTTKNGANQYAWNKLANMLFIEAPLKTGYSTFTGPDDYAFGDESTATELYEALKYFFKENKDYNKSKFIIAGEGLAG
jgi:carboxypeptidase C (cathepsin A)